MNETEWIGAIALNKAGGGSTYDAVPLATKKWVGPGGWRIGAYTPMGKALRRSLYGELVTDPHKRIRHPRAKNARFSIGNTFHYNPKGFYKEQLKEFGVKPGGKDGWDNAGRSAAVKTTRLHIQEGRDALARHLRKLRANKDIAELRRHRQARAGTTPSWF